MSRAAHLRRPALIGVDLRRPRHGAVPRPRGRSSQRGARIDSRPLSASILLMSTTPPRSSRQSYRRFVEDYLAQRLDEATEGGPPKRIEPDDDGATKRSRWRRIRPSGKRREYLREYVRWLRPVRNALVVV